MCCFCTYWDSVMVAVVLSQLHTDTLPQICKGLQPQALILTINISSKGQTLTQS